ncbi:DNA primase DnaG [Acidilobus sp. 7A]|uniref:DNA primase DnaG n=1 Tax=Acidilobus sp. 7A TaxID=1577685 RepID=UPI000764E46D|nr:DNA primase DnaG [Acidilobus sp. 7A]AMD30113.1 DNA primase [Acidilobus sp. 7A]
MLKYLIRASFEVDGRVEKHDIIGAVFGQTEGLLGSEFNLEELQNKDKIGRVHIDLKYQGTKTVGEMQIPSNLDRVETVILAAMIETVDKVGPYSARITVESIEDLRAEKLKWIVQRARELLQSVKEQEPDIKEIVRQVSQKAEAQPRVIEYGEDRLPAGPEVERSDTIIIVEGRADVINLGRYGYANTIAIGGAKERVPKTILDVAKGKKVILFVDGDRGGEMIMRTVLSQMHVDYVARAPKGMEVEQLTGKEIARALAQMVPAEEAMKQLGMVPAQPEAAPQPAEQAAVQQPAPQEAAQVQQPAQPAEQAAQQPQAEQAVQQAPQQPEAAPQPAQQAGVASLIMPKQVLDSMKELKGTLEAVAYDRSWNEVARLKVKDLFNWMQQVESGKVYAVVFDGIITQRLLDAASEKGVALLIGARIGSRVSSRKGDVVFMTFSDIV